MRDEHKEATQRKRGKARESAGTPIAEDAIAAAVPAGEPASELAPAAEAIASAETAPAPEPVATAPSPTAHPVPPAPSPARFEPVPAPVKARPPAARYLPFAAAVLFGLGVGWLAGTRVPDAEASAPGWAEAAASIRDTHADLIRVTGDVKALKVTVDAMKDTFDKGRPDGGVRQLAERLDRSERGSQDVVARLAKLGEQLDRVERAQPDGAKLRAELAERLDRMERSIVATANTVAGAGAAATAKTQVPEPTQTASLPKFDPRQTQLEGWSLLEVYDRAALVEFRKRTFEVAVGDTIQTLGKVLGIEKSGKMWMVVTEKGFIGPPRR